MNSPETRAAALRCLLLGCLAGLGMAQGEKPNVILVITDDQGYGDLGAHGNPVIQTPHMDRLHGESVRLTDFHVDPTCSPTRAALLTGRYSTRTGVWHTIQGRSLMATSELTLAEVLRSAGYRTGHFGKWHLGDNAPLRPQDQGFDEAFYHKGGGVGQGPDGWGNDYFDDIYFQDGRPVATEGYCTDVWFDRALGFIEEHKAEPFFAYISTNAPHSPYFVEDSEVQPYLDQGVPPTMAKFYGMITRIDRNLGRLRARLDELDLAENTILIFMTDNGSAAGWKVARKEEGTWKGYGAGMRAGKGSEYEGGHRVPFFLHWPAGGLDAGRDVAGLTAHIDVLPTLAEFCGVEKPAGPPIDGMGLAAILRGTDQVPAERTLFVHSQRVERPVPWRRTAILRGTQRLVGETELYELSNDPGQATNRAEEDPETVEALKAAYDRWWATLDEAIGQTVRLSLGSPAEPRTCLHSHDWHVDSQSQSPWHQNHIRRGLKSSGYWEVQVERAGRYRVELRRWPEVLDQPLESSHARLHIGAVQVEQDIEADATHATFEVDLPAGPARLQSWLKLEDGEERGAYYAYVSLVE